MDSIHLILLFGAFAISSCSAIEVEILPADDKQFWKAGKTASISCRIDGNLKNKKNINRLTFFYDNEDLKNSSQKIVTRVNSTSIKLEIIKAQRSDSGNYICCLQKKNGINCRARSVTELVFGDEPAKPLLTPANCTSYNMEHMICRIDIVKTEADLGNIPTAWNISWNVTFRYYNGDYRKCDSVEHEGDRIMKCLIKEQFLSKTLYTVKVNAVNLIGSASIQTLVDPLNLVKPNNVANFHVKSNRAGLHLRWHSPLECFDKELLFIILYSTTWENNTCMCADNVAPPTIHVAVPSCRGHHSLIHKTGDNLTSLTIDVPVPGCHDAGSVIHTATKCCIDKTVLHKTIRSKRLISGVQYTVSILSTPLDGTGYSSEPMCKIISTEEGVPTAAPVVHPWSYSLECEDEELFLALYWKEIPIPQRGSRDIKNYSVIRGSQVVSVNGTELSVVLKVDDVQLCSYGLQSLSIKAVTEAGASHKMSAVEVNSPAKVPSRPVSVEKTVDNNKLHVHWQLQPGSHTADVTRVHWCYGSFYEHTNLVQCQNEIGDKKVINSETDINFNIPFSGNPETCANCDWRIAVSMETQGISSGLIWEKNPQGPVIINEISGHMTTTTVVGIIFGVLIPVSILFFILWKCSRCRKFLKKQMVSFPRYKSQILFNFTETQFDEEETSSTKLSEELTPTAWDKHKEKPMPKDSGHNSSISSCSRDRKSHVSNGSQSSSFAKLIKRPLSFSVPNLLPARSDPHLTGLLGRKRTTSGGHGDRAECLKTVNVGDVHHDDLWNTDCDTQETLFNNERQENSASGISESQLLTIADSSVSGTC
ncbi:uncharacterized protein LOC121376557 [Gigantopelta aegis]|uniref:uncharacterized protein LOC121376557 n=1 Tax=Gigantopelta aegis TaxID=1735272 RepID=UPI001B889073|nr:uncharacterized protein LOC121376557 [Gigantopelta aegis]